MYEPVPNKFQVNKRNLGKAFPMLDAPPALSRTEYPTHPTLATKPRWDPATSHTGDPYRAEKEKNKRFEAEVLADVAYSKRHPPKQQHPSLKQREEIFLTEQRAAKSKARIEREMAALVGITPGSTSSSAQDSLGGSIFPAHTLTVADRMALNVTNQVPACRMTSWSLGSF